MLLAQLHLHLPPWIQKDLAREATCDVLRDYGNGGHVY